MQSRNKIEVPAEIWHAIAEYLPERYLYKQYALSRAFFNLALDSRYRRVDIFKYHWHNDPLGRTKSYLRHLMEPHIIHRIHHARITGFAFNELDLEWKSYKNQRAKTAPLGLCIRSRRRHSEHIPFVELAYQLVSTAPHVTSLKIKRGPRNTLEYWEFVRRVWAVLAPRVCSLTLVVDLEELAFVVEHCLEAPCLLELKWESDGVPKKFFFPSAAQSVGIVQKFIDGFAIRLEQLRLFSSNSSPGGQANHLCQLANLFRLATDIPNFLLKTSMLLYDPSPLVKIIHNAQSHLETLRLAAHDEVTLQNMGLGLGLLDDGTPLRLKATRHLTIYLPRSTDACPAHRRSKAILETAKVYLDAMTEA